MTALEVEPIADDAWMIDARCRNDTSVTTDFFFPQRNEDTEDRRGYCALCPVQDACIEYGILMNEEGWWGCSRRERVQLRKMIGVKRKPMVDQIRPTRPLHGTEYAYKKCGPPKCDACRQARREAAIRRGELTGSGYARTEDGGGGVRKGSGRYA